MIFDREEIKVSPLVPGDKKLMTSNPSLKVGDVIRIAFDDKETKMPGCRRLKKGIYDVKDVHKSYTSSIPNDNSYVLVGRGSKYEYHMNCWAIDKAIMKGFIEKLS